MKKSERPRPQSDLQPEHGPTDIRRARKRQERQLLALVVTVLIVVGGGLIALIYGPSALVTALPCLLSGAGVILLLYLLFILAERWVNS